MTETIEVKSSAIKAFGHEEDRLDLTVLFESGKMYIYHPVSKHFFAKIREAESAGKFFNKHIKNNEALTCFKFIK